MSSRRCSTRFLVVLVVCLSTLISSTFQHEHGCGHIPPKPENILISAIGSGVQHRVNKRQTHQNLRIRYFFDESINTINAEKFRIINETVLPEAINYWQQALKVKSFSLPIRLARRCANDSGRHDDDRGDNYCLERCEDANLCGEIGIPEEHLEECRVCESDKDNRVCMVKQTSNSTTIKRGVAEADFVLYISTLLTQRCLKSNTIAYAAHCQLESRYNRPIAGHANICPNSISTKAQDLETLVSTFKHEILHALGFSVSLYALYRDENGVPYNTRLPTTTNSTSGRAISNIASSLLQRISRRVIRKVVRKDWKVRGHLVDRTAMLISTPRVLKEVRDHFDCPTLEGAELENQGEEGTIMTHWEKRLFENEAMTGTHTQNPIYSRITLALMEDTGWYQANYSLAQPLEWGKGLGCDFAMKSCKEWIEMKRSQGESIHPFCDKIKREPLQTECTDNRDSVALCNLRQYDTELETHFQNFENLSNVKPDQVAMFGGSVALADYCPYIQEFTWKLNDEIVRGSKCNFVENNPLLDKNFALEFYGENSKCFNHNHEMWEERNCLEIRQWQHWGSGCYQYECRDGLLHIVVGNNTFTCLKEHQQIKIELLSSGWLHRGTIVCPKCSELCSNCKTLDRDSLYQLKRQLKPTIHELECAAAAALGTSTQILIATIIAAYFTVYSHW